VREQLFVRDRRYQNIGGGYKPAGLLATRSGVVPCKGARTLELRRILALLAAAVRVAKP